MSIWDFKSEQDYNETQAERQKWFNKIAPSGNWKMPIDKWIPKEDYENCNEAAIWFTGGKLDIIEESDYNYHVVSGGYYANIGA